MPKNIKHYVSVEILETDIMKYWNLLFEYSAIKGNIGRIDQTLFSELFKVFDRTIKDMDEAE